MEKDKLTKSEVISWINSHPRIVLLISTLAVGPAAIFAKLVIYNSAFTIAFWRVLFAGVISLIISFMFKEKSNLLPRETKDKWLILLAGIFLALHFSLWFLSLHFVSIALSVIIVTTTPIWMTFVAFIFMGIIPTKYEKIAIVLVIISMIIMLFETNNLNTIHYSLQFAIGIGLALISSWFIVGYFFIAKKVLVTQSLWGYFGLVNLSASATLLLIIMIRGEHVFPKYNTDYGVFLVMALGPSLIGHAGYNYSMKLTRPHDVGFAILGEPLIASILAYLIFKEIPDITTIFGGILIFIAIYLVVVVSEEESPLI